ncbi:energy-coupling factor transporter transmembrane component T family protein [Phosphitispora fastidiosa]|uniref:energy-coupling factor transporter transmembrane component T family protein n=1 Tax=Phosphitispora fastidiosa TaxID=2837202 RepID=UPI001E31EF8B|nr:energy-coupling factor transporter transmembrane component T [Phosphitispora fastidiosa]MBU7007431.1 energy-coupling factor transport system permease protein [Phosphitispora fastidiosa]
MEGIVIGQYVPGSSLLHRLDPRTKIIVSAILLWLVFVVENPAEFAAYGLFILVLYIIGGVAGSFLKVMKPGIFLIVITLVLNMFFTPGETMFSIGPVPVSRTGLENGLFLGVKIMYLILLSSLVTLVTSPVRMTDGLERLMKPFQRIGLPASELAMMINIALRFIPTFWEETDKIIKAQKSRGADFESWHLQKRAKYMTALLVPLFVSSFRKADELAMAMESRGYVVGMHRSSLHKLEFRPVDFLVLALTVTITGAFIMYKYF